MNRPIPGLDGGISQGDVAALDPTTGRWYQLPPPATGFGPLDGIPVWTGAELMALSANGNLWSLHA